MIFVRFHGHGTLYFKGGGAYESTWDRGVAVEVTQNQWRLHLIH